MNLKKMDAKMRRAMASETNNEKIRIFGVAEYARNETGMPLTDTCTDVRRRKNQQNGKVGKNNNGTWDQ